MPIMASVIVDLVPLHPKSDKKKGGKRKVPNKRVMWKLLMQKV
jgi:hypothetical protein